MSQQHRRMTETAELTDGTPVPWDTGAAPRRPHAQLPGADAAAGRLAAGEHLPGRQSGHGPRRGRPPQYPLRAFAAPMGLALRRERLAIVASMQAGGSFDVPTVAAKLDPPSGHDTRFLPRPSTARATSRSTRWPEEVTISGSSTPASPARVPSTLPELGAAPALSVHNGAGADRPLRPRATNTLVDAQTLHASVRHPGRCDRRAQPSRLVVADRPSRSLGSKVVRPFRRSARAAAPGPKLLRAALGVITVRRSLRSMQCLALLAALAAAGVPPGPQTATAPPQGTEPPSLTRRKARLRVSVRSFVGHDDRNPVLEPIGIVDLWP
jgi:hypothetical protein